MKFLYLSILLLSILCSCSEHDTNSIMKDSSFMVEFNLKTSPTITYTRSLSTIDENHIDNLYLLIFDSSNRFLYFNKALSIDNTSIDGTTKKAVFKFTKEDVVEDVKLAFIANLANAEAVINEIAVNTTIDNVQSLFKLDCSSIWSTNSSENFTPLPMWNLQNRTLTLTEGNNLTSIKLIRSLARVNVTLGGGQGLTGINLVSVDIYNYRKGALLWPDTNKFDSNSNVVTSPTINNTDTPLADVEESLSYVLSSPSNALIRAIYMAETDNTQENTVCIVLGLLIGDEVEPEYFKIEMVDEKFNSLPILRNHSYNCNIVAFSGLRGHATKLDALHSPAENLNYEINVIENSAHNVMVTDEQFLLCMDKDRFVFDLDGGSEDWLIYTDAPNGWRIDPSSFKVNGVSVEQPSDLSINVYHSDIPVEDGVSDLNYYLTVQLGASIARNIQFNIQTVPTRIYKTISIIQK